MDNIESSLETSTVKSLSSTDNINITNNHNIILDTSIEEDNKNTNNKLFSNITYFIINTVNSDIDKLLDQNGAKQDKYLGDFLTHVICDDFSIDNPECYEAKDVFELKIIKSDWVLKSLYAKSLLPIEAFSHEEKNNLFKNLKFINVNMPLELSKQIKITLQYFGGKCENISDFNEEEIRKSGTTHAVSINYDQLSQKLDNLSVKLITPDWVIESIDKNNLLNEYEYNPKFLLESSENLKALVNEYNEKIKKKDEEEKLMKNLNLKEQSNCNNTKKVDILENVNTQIILDDFNNINTSHNKSTDSPSNNIQTSIIIDNDNQKNNNNQILTPSKQKSKRSSKTNQISANPISSLNDMNEIFQSVISATSDLANDETENTKTNSFNKPPVYLNMIKPLQQNYPKFPTTQCIFDEDSTSQDDNETNYLVQENSHLIQFDSCLLGCVFHLKSCETYFTEDCLNEWEKVINRFGGKCLSEYSNGNTIKVINQQQEITHVLCPNRLSETYRKAIEERKRVVTPYWLEDVLQEQKLRPPWLAYHFPSPYEFKEGPLTNHIISLHGFTLKEKLILKTMIWLLNGKYSSHLSNINSFLISKNNEGIKVEKAKRWNINVVNAIWLSELYLGNLNCLINPLSEKYLKIDNVSNHFHFDSGYVSEFMDQWKQLIKLPIEKIKEQTNSSNKNNNQKQRSPLKRYNRSLSGSPTSNNELISKISKLDEISTEITNGTTSSISWIKPQSKIPLVLFTGFDPIVLQQYQRDVIGLGGILAKQLNQTTHLIVDRIERTAKLLKTISSVDYIIHIKWLLDSKLNGRFLDPMLYQVKDERFEKHYGCCLKESLLRAKLNKPLFSGLHFYLSPSVRPSYADLEEMIKSADGIVMKDVPTMQMLIEPYKDADYERRIGLTSKYILIGSQDDLCILKPFIEKKIPIYHEELVLSGLLRQKLDSQIYRLNAQ